MSVKIIRALVAIGLMTSAPAAFGQTSLQEVKTASELPVWKTITIGTQLDLVLLSVAALGFRQGGTLADVHARAVRLGFELCPEEVGPQLRLQYLQQPVGEFLHVAMKPQRTYGGDLVDFTLANSGAGLSLLGGSAQPDLVVARNVVFVFVRPSPAQVAIVPEP